MKTLFPQHEGISLEYKEAADSLPKTFSETVCVFLNYDGGLIVLGVADNCTVTGVNPDAIGRIMSDIANFSDNPEKIESQYTPGATPLFEELNDIFSATIPLPGEEKTLEVAPEVTPEVVSLLLVMDGEMSRREIMRQLGLNDEKHFREQYQQRAVKAGVIELTIPDKPNSPLQKYRLTAQGRALVQSYRKP